MTESFLSALREFLLAEAQECYWQQAVLRESLSLIHELADKSEGSYKNGLIGKLSMKVSDYYKSALAAANSTDFPSAGFFPPVSSSLRFFPLREEDCIGLMIELDRTYYSQTAPLRGCSAIPSIPGRSREITIWRGDRSSKGCRGMR
jgi:hypothetical protein